MLEELTEYKSFGTAEHIRLILACLSNGPISVDDLNTWVSSKGSVGIPRVREVALLLKELGLCWLHQDEAMYLTSAGVELVGASDDAVRDLGLLLFSRLSEEGILPISLIRFDVASGRYYFTQTAIKSRYASFRNLLVVSDVLQVREHRFLLCPEAEDAIRQMEPDWKRGMTPEQLAVRMNRDREAGELAEQYVMAYERKRLGDAKAGAIEQVSLTSVSAGFDIASFETSASLHYDRFIEVKAYGRDGFYLSAGELEVARRYGRRYFIYVVELNKTIEESYIPLIIQNPANYLKSCSDWRIVPDGLRITRLSNLM